MKTKIYVVPSTHWDREWILPFEKFRYKLVRTIDGLLDILENNPDYKYFHFDGQTTVISDYIEIRPENKERLLKLIREKRILIGPFRNMLDCLLPSGEAITRNLQSGQKDCMEWGTEPHKLGYTCDVFGQNAQMPQIYRNFGISSCLLLRGREGYEDDKFIWRGADGSEVLAHRADPDYSYADFYLIARWPDQISGGADYERMAADLKKHLDENKGRMKGGCHFMIDGYDNLEPEGKLTEFLAYLNGRLADYEFIFSDFNDYNAECKKYYGSLSLHEGVIYSSSKEGTGSFLMKNVASSMVHLKQMNMAAEDKLCVVTEPLDLFTELVRKDGDNGYCPVKNKADFFNYAWAKLVSNQPHDSLGGTCCSAAHSDNENDYKRANETIEAALEDSLSELARNVNTGDNGKDGYFIVYNPCETYFEGVAEVSFKVKSGTDFASSEIRDSSGNLLAFTVLEKTSATEQIAPYKRMAEYIAYDIYKTAIPLKLKAFSYEVLNFKAPVFERNFEKGEWKFSRFDKVRKDYSSMRVGLNEFDNGVLYVSFNADGSLNVTDKTTGKTYEKLFVFEDDSDVGEGWNRISTRVDERVSTAVGNARFSVINDDERIARFRVRHKLLLPECEDGAFERKGDLKEQEIDVIYTLKRGSERIECEADLFNDVDNHRLRVGIPTGIKTNSFYPAMPYGMQEWPVERGDHSYDIEQFSPVVPGQGVCTLSDAENTVSVYTGGLYEFEVSDRADRSVYITLFRAFPKETFFLKSQTARMKRTMKFQFAVDFGKGELSDIYKRAKAYRNGIISRIATGEHGFLGCKCSFAEIEGGAVLSSLRRSDLITGKPTVRIFDVDGGCSGHISFMLKVKRAFRVKMNGEIIKEEKISDGKISYCLKKNEIATWQLEF